MDLDVKQPFNASEPREKLHLVGGKWSPPETLEDLISILHKIFEDDVINIDEVKDIMTSFRCDPKEWRKFAKFNPHRYTRNLIDAGNGKFNLMILCWNEGQGSSIHAHADSHCFLKVVEGVAREELYEWPSSDSEEMKTKSVGMITCGAVGYMNDSIGLHRVENPSHSDRLVTLHLYSPPYNEALSFDQRSGKRRPVRVTFWSEFGKRTHWSKVESAMYDHSLPTK